MTVIIEFVNKDQTQFVKLYRSLRWHFFLNMALVMLRIYS